MFFRIIFVLIAIFGSGYLWSQDTAKIMFYNLLQFPQAPPANRDLILRDILDDIKPGVFMVAELQNEVGADLILNNALNNNTDIYVSAPFVFNTSGNGGDIQQLLYYNTTKFSLEFTDIIQTGLRDINSYQLKALTTTFDIDSIIIEFFVAHFKASQGIDNEDIRFQMALNFTDYVIANLSSDANVIFAGDFNFYSANENGFQQLFIGNTLIPLNDPLNAIGEWHTNSGFSSVHTQSTRQSNNAFNDFGAGGGLDDRFDFIFVSGNLLNPTHEVSYLENTYQTYGNNGNCYNEDIIDNNCGGFYSQDIRNRLWNMSDHLPLVMELKFQQDFLSLPDEKPTYEMRFISGNIVRDHINLMIPLQISDKIEHLRIYNYRGQQVDEIIVKSLQLILSVSDYKSGLYFIRANNGKILKFLKSS